MSGHLSSNLKWPDSRVWIGLCLLISLHRHHALDMNHKG